MQHHAAAPHDGLLYVEHDDLRSGDRYKSSEAVHVLLVRT